MALEWMVLNMSVCTKVYLVIVFITDLLAVSLFSALWIWLFLFKSINKQNLYLVSLIVLWPDGASSLPAELIQPDHIPCWQIRWKILLCGMKLLNISNNFLLEVELLLINVILSNCRTDFSYSKCLIISHGLMVLCFWCYLIVPKCKIILRTCINE